MILTLIFCVVTAPLILINATIIIKGFLYPDKPPGIFGYSPMVVLTGSMVGESGINPGDLIFVKQCDPETLEKGDIITFRSGAEQTPVTHRINEVIYSDGKIEAFITKGDANSAVDMARVYKSNIIGVYAGRIAGAGDIVMFIQQPAVMIALLAVPLCIVAAVEFIRRGKEYKAEKQRNEKLKEELERLKKRT